MDKAEPTQLRPSTAETETTLKRSLFSRLSFGHVIMIAAGLLAFLLNVALLSSQDDTVTVAVAASDLNAGTRLQAADVGFASVDANGPFVDRLLNQTAVETLLGQIITRDVDEGAPLLSDDLRQAAAPGAGRAMSIPITPMQAVAADLRRGDRVDIISVVDGLAEYIATGIEVLTVADPGEGRLANTTDFSVTVAVDDVVALAIARALDLGDLHLVRSTGATEVQTEAVDSGGEG